MIFGLEPWALATLVLASFLTAIVSGVLGLAGGVALLGVMSLVLPAPSVVPIHGMAQLFANGSRTLLLIRRVYWRYALTYLLPLTVGVGLGAYYGRGLDYSWLDPVIAGMLILVLALRRLAPKLRRPPLWAYAVVGFFVGTLTLFVGATGPFMAPVFQRDDLEPQEIVATMAICQSWGHLLKAPAFLLFGFDFGAHAGLLAVLFCSSVAGTYVGRQVLEKLDRERFARIIELVLLGLALWLIVRAVG
ncbi:MAG: sulfite exporter TauE/SafE family protein [Myxococcota bacterium]